MTKTSETIIFFGSGPVAAESLRLLAENFAIEAVVTKPRAVHHKGEVPVLNVAEHLSLPVHTATDKRSLDDLFADTPFQSRLGILIDFGIIVSQKVINSLPLGIINSHFSILPEWRGADPITFSILSGQKQTGVSLMLLVEKMDEGPLLGYGEYDMPPDITTPQLTDYLINLSDALLIHEVPSYLADKRMVVSQDITGRKVSYSRKLTKVDSIINWHKSAEQLEREIRAFIDWPKSRTEIAGHAIIITKAHVKNSDEYQRVHTMPGEVLFLPNKQFAIVTSKDLLVIDRLKPVGKPEMSAQAFMAGYNLRPLAK